jgi:hypothetical protein
MAQPSQFAALAKLREGKQTAGAAPAKQGNGPKQKAAKPEPVSNDHAKAAPTAAGAGDIVLPSKKPTGKRSNPEFRGRTVLLKIASQRAAEQLLKDKHPGTDFSDLMQALLEKWLTEVSG